MSTTREGPAELDDPRLPTRFWDKVQMEPNTGCWLWAAGTDTCGYGKFRRSSDGRKRMAHRVSYEALVGPIPSGLELDHLCRTPACVNPEHVEPVTHAENMRRGLSGELKKQCPRGHVYDEANTFLKTNGGRACRECSRAWDREYYEQRGRAMRAAKRARRAA